MVVRDMMEERLASLAFTVVVAAGALEESAETERLLCPETVDLEPMLIRIY